MSEFSGNAEAIRNARPAAATIQITLEDGSADTITLNPFWAAKLIKRLRINGSHSISISGMIPDDSPERTPVNQSWACNTVAVDQHAWAEWLKGKPTP